MIKFMYNGLKLNGKLYPAHISFGESIYGDERIVVYCRDFYFPEDIKKEFQVKNGTDIREDYFENDRFAITQGQPYFKEALAAYILDREKKIKRIQARINNPKTKQYLIDGYKSDICWERNQIERIKKTYLKEVA